MVDDRTSSRAQRRTRVITLVLLAVLLVSASIFLTGRKDSDIIVVTFPSGKQLETEVADTPEKLLFGLAFREGLPPDTGMLYIFESTGPHRMQTKEYRIPVDMIWIDESRRIVHLMQDVPPCRRDPCPFHGPMEPARYVLQAAAGFVRMTGVSPGDELKFSLRL
jgi:hypothetical protein